MKRTEETMAPTRPPMRCPSCRAEMNHHADKLTYGGRPGDRGYDDALGGAVEETHACPGCGAVATRPAE
jgi:hypothetical protein